MDAMMATLIAVWISFCMGVFIVLWVGRGLFGKYFKAFMSGNALLVVHLERGGFVFRVGSNVPGAPVVKYPLWGKNDMRIVTLVPEACLRAVRVLWVHVNEKDSAPFVFEKVQSFYDERLVPVLKGGVPVLGEDGSPVSEKKVVLAFRKFLGWDDSSIIRTVVQWALIRPRRKLANAIDIRMIIIALVIIIIVALVASQLLKGDVGGVENVI